MYNVWIKIDEELPWIELKGAYRTRRGAQDAAREFLESVKVRVVQIPEKNQANSLIAIE